LSVACIAHRGDSWNYPENTRLAFDAALRAGADGIELDVQLSRDGIPVVYHDRTLTRAGGGRRRVHTLTLAELQRLDAGASPDTGRPLGIPTLEEVLERYGRRTRLLLEIKVRGTDAAPLRELTEAVARRVGRHRLGGTAEVLCFEVQVLDHLRAVAPKLRRVLNVDRRRRPALWRAIDRVDAVSADVAILDDRFARRVADAGKPLLVYTCNTPRRVGRALAAGAVAVMSDRPGWLRERLAAAEASR